MMVKTHNIFFFSVSILFLLENLDRPITSTSIPEVLYCYLKKTRWNLAAVTGRTVCLCGNFTRTQTITPSLRVLPAASPPPPPAQLDSDELTCVTKEKMSCNIPGRMYQRYIVTRSVECNKSATYIQEAEM